MERYIYSLRGLFCTFGVRFFFKPPFPRKDYEELKAAGHDISEIIRKLKESGKIWRGEGIEVCALSREDRWPAMADHNVRYIVTGHDEHALRNGEDIHDLLNDLVHAAECGCKGCSDRMNRRREHYQKRCEA